MDTLTVTLAELIPAAMDAVTLTLMMAGAALILTALGLAAWLWRAKP